MKKLLSTAFFLIYASSAFAAYEDALRLYEEGKYRESLKLLADELDITRDLEERAPNYNLRFLAAHNHWKLGNDESAIIHFKRCIDMKNRALDPYIDLSLFYLDRNNLTEADRYVRIGLQKEKKALFYYILGEISLKRNNSWKAKELFETANSLDQENFASYNGLGIALMRLGKFGDANTAFTVAMALNPSSPEVLNNLGMSLEKLGKNEEAAAYYKKAWELDGENKTILANLNRIKTKVK